MIRAAGVRHASPAEWPAGIAAAYQGRVFVSPAVDGWVFVGSTALPDAGDAHHPDRITPLITALSQTLRTKVQYFGMAVPMPRPIPAQRVRVAPAGQLLLRLKQVHDRFQLVQILVLLLDAPHISFKSSCREKLEGHQSCSRSSRNER